MPPTLHSRQAFCGHAAAAKVFEIGPLLLRKASAWAAVFFLALLIGCASSPAHKTLYAVGHTVDTAVQTYMNLVVDGKVRTNDVPMVSRVYQDFQIVYRLSLQGAQFNANAPPGTNLVARAGVVLGVVAAAQGDAR